MKKSTIIKIAVSLGVIILIVIGLHLIGNSLVSMIKHHMGI